MYIKVRVKPNSKKEDVEKKSEESFIISVKEPAERNLANKRVLELLSSKLKISLNHIRIISGHHTPNKLVSIKE